MWLSLIVIVMILAIVFFQAIHGLFSSLIMALCTLVCTLLAFNFYEPVASLLHDRIPAYADGIVLLALLVIPLFAIRFLIDRFLPGNIVPNVWVDRALAGAFGLVTALLLVGTMVIALQMLPFDRSMLGYDPYDDTLQPADSLPINAPGFALAVVNKLSAGSMAGRPFSEAHPDLTLEMWALRNRQSGARTDCLPIDLLVKNVADVTKLPYPMGDGKTETFGTSAPQHPGIELADSQVFIVRVEVVDNARDVDNWWRLRGTHFRLMTADGMGFFPVGYMVTVGEWETNEGEKRKWGEWELIGEDVGALQISRKWTRQTPTLTADLLFRVPLEADRRPRPLSHLEFRRVCRAKLPKINTLQPRPKPTSGEDYMPPGQIANLPHERALQRKETYGEVAVTSRGLNHVFRPTKAVVSAALPAGFNRASGGGDNQQRVTVTLAGESTRINVVVVNSGFQSGKVIGPTESFWRLAGNNPRELIPVSGFIEPGRMKMVKLYGAPVSATSLMTGALGASQRLDPSVSVGAKVFLAGAGEQRASGAWVKWVENNVEHVHYYFNANTDQDARHHPDLLDVIRTYMKHRRTTEEVGLIFLVPDDAKVTSFSVSPNKRVNCESPLSMGRPPRARPPSRARR